MIDGKKVVCVTPAGRRRYMRELVPHILSTPCVDRYDIWLNTRDPQDVRFIEGLTRFPKINIVRQPDGIVDGVSSIGAFFRTSMDPDTVYIRFDDDVVFLEAGLIERLVRFRIENPEFFLVSPLILNNAIVTNLLQERGNLPLGPVVGPECMDPIGWEDGAFASRLWSYFLALIKTGQIASLHTGNAVLGPKRFSINCISWLGETFRDFGGRVTHDEEEDVTVNKPRDLKRRNCIFGGAVAGHFAFFPQRAAMDATGILSDIARINAGLDYVDGDIYRQVQALAGETADAQPAPRNGLSQTQSNLTDELAAIFAGPFERGKWSRRTVGFASDPVEIDAEKALADKLWLRLREDAVMLHPPADVEDVSTVLYKALDLNGARILFGGLKVDNARSQPVVFRVSIEKDGETIASSVNELDGGRPDMFVLQFDELQNSPYQLRLETWMAPGATNNHCAWAVFSGLAFAGPFDVAVQAT